MEPASNSELFQELVRELSLDGDHRFVLAELNDLLTKLAPGALREATRIAPISDLSPLLQNYVAAMVELACQVKGVEPPAWPAAVEPLEQPWFGTDLQSLRPYLLRESPVAFERRNIFIDSSIGARV